MSETTSSGQQGSNRLVTRLRWIYSALPWKRRLAFALLALLAISGALNQLSAFLGWEAVFNTAEGLLDNSMTSASVTTLALMTTKGGLELLKSVDVDVIVASGNVGALLGHGPYELVDFAFQFFLASTTLIAAQIGFLEIIELVALPLFLGLGGICLAIQPGGATLFGRLGRLLVVTGLVLYLIFPAVLGAIGSAYDKHRVEAEIENYESFAVLSQRASDLSPRDLASSEGRQKIGSTFSQGIQAGWDSFTSVLVSYLLMFVIAPLAAIGISWLIVRQTMNQLQMGDQVGQVEGATQAGYHWLRDLGRSSRSEKIEGENERESGQHPPDDSSEPGAQVAEKTARANPAATENGRPHESVSPPRQSGDEVAHHSERSQQAPAETEHDRSTPNTSHVSNAQHARVGNPEDCSAGSRGEPKGQQGIPNQNDKKEE